MSIFVDLLDPKLIRILNVLIASRRKLFHLKKLSIESKVPLASTFRIINKLVKLNLVDQVNIDKMKIYRLAKNKHTRELIRVLGDKR